MCGLYILVFTCAEDRYFYVGITEQCPLRRFGHNGRKYYQQNKKFRALLKKYPTGLTMTPRFICPFADRLSARQAERKLTSQLRHHSKCLNVNR